MLTVSLEEDDLAPSRGYPEVYEHVFPAIHREIQFELSHT